ncbi:MAG: Do family serine endopeptidase [Burkholderiales bacterium]|nr:Do family serine endopeptidase [Burkholderiales bacterium]
MRRLWLLFAQTVTVCVAALFVVATFRPEWLPPRGAGEVVTVTQLEPARAAQPAASARADSYHEAVAKAMPAVVGILTAKEVRSPRLPFFGDPFARRFFGEMFGEETRRATSLGSGVIVSPEGFILTNNHVVESAEEIEVALADGRKFAARVVGADPETDLAVLRVEGEALPAIAFGSSESLRVGDVVLAIGNPFGVGQTVTLGIVSALGRSGLGINTFENFIQTDAAINPGNSGGALVDARGNLVGINTAIFSQTGGSVGIGFAMPVATARSVLEQIVKTGTVTRGWIGVELAPLTPALAESYRLARAEGAVIGGVLRNGPADRAGAKPGDVLVAIDGKRVADPQAVLDAVAALEPGRSAVLTVNRRGQTLDLSVTVGRRPKPPPRAE